MHTNVCGVARNKVQGYESDKDVEWERSNFFYLKSKKESILLKEKNILHLKRINNIHYTTYFNNI